MGRGNIAIDKLIVKMVVDGKIIIPLPNILVENRYYPMFFVFSPAHVMIVGVNYMQTLNKPSYLSSHSTSL